MTTINRHALVPYTAHEMYSLVEDIRAYPQFLPWCKATQVLSHQGQEIQASITLARSSLEKTFTTQNTLIPNQSIEMRLLQGPFSRLHGHWQFLPLGDDAGSKVSLHMDFEISNKVLKLTLGPVFTQIMDALVDAFISRARDLYGRR